MISGRASPLALVTSVCSSPSHVNFGIIRHPQNRTGVSIVLMAKTQLSFRENEAICGRHMCGRGMGKWFPWKLSPLMTALAIPTPEDIWDTLLVNSLTCLSSEFSPAFTDICILIYSMCSYQKPCFATCFFQPHSKSWASFFVTLLDSRGTLCTTHVNTIVGWAASCSWTRGCFQYLQSPTVLPTSG